jgi:hypothetical protein
MSFEDINDTNEAHEKRIVRCRSCRARIIFLHTVNGTKMPVDADTVDAEDEVYERGKHVSHFSTCDRPDAFRKPKP